VAASSRPHRPSKRLGQNFLIDHRIAEQIVSSVSPSPADTVLEPGPGHGTLTKILLKKAGQVIVVEKDPALVKELQKSFEGQPNLKIIEDDILKMEGNLPPFNKIVSTPPYYISSKLTLFLTGKKFEVAAIVFQKEFGDRLLAEPGSADYGRLSVMTRRKLDVEKIREISRNAFRPAPKVDSTLLRLTPKEGEAEIDEVLFAEMARGIFTQRRRLVKGAILHFMTLKYGREKGKKLLDSISIPEQRVYQLSIDQLENLSLQLWRAVSTEIASSETNP
jgi:16S rRNA (adenine1518-N6/adenine1519-N6)-dimethyltransferase